MTVEADLDLVIVGGGIGGVICLKYARDAGLKAVLLERRDRIGGVWRDLPSWQDIQIRKEDWTLGDLELAGEDQASILANIQAWVDRFGLSAGIHLNSPVVRAQWRESGWRVETDATTYKARWLIAATGGHNRPVVPRIQRSESSIAEYHSSALRDLAVLRGRRVTVVGGGASAYDLLDLCLENDASAVTWVYRSTRWMRPTRRPKYHGTSMRTLARYQILGVPMRVVNRLANRDLRARYAKAGVEAIMPERAFDFRRDQIIPGRRRMIREFARIERHRGEVRSLRGSTILLSDGDRVECNVLLWGTGYAADFGYLGLEDLGPAKSLNEISRRCHSVFRSADAPNLFLLAPGVLETNNSTPWAYAHVAKSIMAHIEGRPVFDDPPREDLTNYFDLVRLLAQRDRRTYPRGLWYVRYLWLAFIHPDSRPMPIP